ncbi:MAG: ABC transporter ATP-binding protein, partial [Clostridia bacterium]|nr:ABC transporter ATP-binding protein [Clostridia bacterium]
AVDTATEAKIRNSFNTDLKGMTKIIIAQRISSVIDADKIVVIEDGKIVGIGKHSDLIDNCSAYTEIYYSQMDKKEAAQ